MADLLSQRALSLIRGHALDLHASASSVRTLCTATASRRRRSADRQLHGGGQRASPGAGSCCGLAGVPARGGPVAGQLLEVINPPSLAKG